MPRKFESGLFTVPYVPVISNPLIPKKKAIISGITGQIGSYLAEYLLMNHYDVHGIVRRSSAGQIGQSRIEHIRNHVTLHNADLTDLPSLISVIETVRPAEFYNLGAMSFVPTSWNQPFLTADVTALGPQRVLEAIKISNVPVKFFQASSSEQFGKVQETPQNEKTPFYPRSPYGAAKAYAHHITVNYRESHGMFAACGIMFNNESPRRGFEFVTRKISSAVAKARVGLPVRLKLGNLDARRDWGFTGDYVKAIHLIMQQQEPDDYVIATGRTHSVDDFLRAAINHAGVEPDFVETDDNLFRPAEVDLLHGDPTKISSIGWAPTVDFGGLVKMMVDSDIAHFSSIV